MKCPHGYDGEQESAADQDERSSCCGAFVTFSGDGDLYCKCCYALTTGGALVAAIQISVRGKDETT